MSFRLRCTRYRQSRGRSLCPRMEATAALRSHPPATGGPLSVAWLHVCGVCVSVPGQGRCQRWACHSPRRGSWGLGTRGTCESSLSPGTPLAQSVVLETGPQPSPSTATFAPTPASLQGAAHHRSCRPGRSCANCGAGRPAVALTSPQFSPSAAASSPLSLLPVHHGMCVLLAPLCPPVAVEVEALLPAPLTPPLTLRRKASKSQEHHGNSLLPSPTSRMGPWETEAFLGPHCCLPCPSPPARGMDRAGAPPRLSTTQQEKLWPTSRGHLAGDAGASPRLWATALHAGTQLLPSDLLPVQPWCTEGTVNCEWGGNRVQLDNPQ